MSALFNSLSYDSRKVRTAAVERRPITSAKTVMLTHEKGNFSVLSKNRKVIAKRKNRKEVSMILLFLLYSSVPRSDSRKIENTVRDALIILTISTANRWYVSIAVSSVSPMMVVR